MHDVAIVSPTIYESIDKQRSPPYGAPTHRTRARRNGPGAHFNMPPCTSCGELDDVRLFESRYNGRTTRHWSCPACAREIEQDPAPRWIERAALRQLPTKDLQRLLSDRRWHERRHATDRAVGRG